MFLKWNRLKNEDHYTYYSWFEALCTMMSLTVLSPHLYKNEKVASHEIKSTWKYNLGSNIQYTCYSWSETFCVHWFSLLWHKFYLLKGEGGVMIGSNWKELIYWTAKIIMSLRLTALKSSISVEFHLQNVELQVDQKILVKL